MSRFPTPGHLAAWAGMCPGSDQSGGKRRSARSSAVWRPAAAAHSMVIIIFCMLRDGTVYQDRGAEADAERDRHRCTHHAVRRLESLGFRVTLHPLPTG